MKRNLCAILVTILCVTIAATVSSEVTLQTPTPPPKKSRTVETVQDILDDWSMRYMNSPQWASLKSVKEGQSLPTLILLRLAITYNLDEYPGLTLTQMADFEPRIEAKEVNGRLVWEYRSMTIDGDIYLSIDALTGVLLKVETSKGGNG